MRVACRNLLQCPGVRGSDVVGLSVIVRMFIQRIVLYLVLVVPMRNLRATTIIYMTGLTTLVWRISNVIANVKGNVYNWIIRPNAYLSRKNALGRGLISKNVHWRISYDYGNVCYIR